MELAQLRALRELRDHGSVSAAAHALNLTASAVSQQLATLQRASALPLVTRNGRNLSLTAHGRELAQIADSVFVSLSQAEQLMNVPATRSVSITAIHSVALAWFPRLLEWGERARIELHLRDEDVATDQFAALASSFDLVLAHRPAGTQPWPMDALRVVPVMREPLALALAQNHPLAKSTQIRLADLTNERWVAVHQGFSLEPLLAALSETAGRPVHVSHSINEFHVAAAVVATGKAVCLLPVRTGLPDYLADRIVLREIADLHIQRQIDVLLRHDTYERAEVRAVLEWIQQVGQEKKRE